MTTRTKTRKRLHRLQQDYQAAKEQLYALGVVIPGSIVRRTYRCGKTSCHCHQDQHALHGPYYQWTCKVKAKTVGMNLESSVAIVAKEWIRNHRKMRRLLEHLHQIAREMLNVMVQLDRMETERSRSRVQKSRGKDQAIGGK